MARFEILKRNTLMLSFALLATVAFNIIFLDTNNDNCTSPSGSAIDHIQHKGMPFSGGAISSAANKIGLSVYNRATTTAASDLTIQKAVNRYLAVSGLGVLVLIAVTAAVIKYGRKILILTSAIPVTVAKFLETLFYQRMSPSDGQETEDSVQKWQIEITLVKANLDMRNTITAIITKLQLPIIYKQIDLIILGEFNSKKEARDLIKFLSEAHGIRGWLVEVR